MSMHGPHKDLYENGRSSFIQNRRSISKLWSIHTMEDHLAIKRNKILTQATTWLNFKALWSEKKPDTKNTYCMIPLIQHSKTDNLRYKK